MTSTLDGLVGHDIVLPSKGRRLSVCVCMCDDANNHSYRLLNAQSFQVALVVKNPTANAGAIRDSGSIPGPEDPLEEGRAMHFSILAWRIPWTEEPGGLQSIGSQRVGHD